MYLFRIGILVPGMEHTTKFTMYKTHRKVFLVLFFLISLHTSLMFNDVYAKPTVELTIYPDPGKEVIAFIPHEESIALIPLGSRSQIWITAESSEENVTFKWKHNGPGKLRAIYPGLGIYNLPDKIDKESKDVTITVTVTNDKEKTASGRVTFTLFSPIVAPRQVVIIPVNIISSPNRNIIVECEVVVGEVECSQQGIIYTARGKPGDKDIVTVRAVDEDTGEIIDWKIIKITIRDKSQ